MQVAVEASSRSSDLHWDIPVSLQHEREPEYRVESQKETAEHHLQHQGQMMMMTVVVITTVVMIMVMVMMVTEAILNF